MRGWSSFATLILALAPLAAQGQGAHEMRATKVIGAPVVNDANETVGKVDDVILGDDAAPYLVLSVGGFLGVGSKLVVLPYDTIRKTDDKLIMPGVSREALRSLPDFTYAAR